jgi:hypothetical protein
MLAQSLRLNNYLVAAAAPALDLHHIAKPSIAAPCKTQVNRS